MFRGDAGEWNDNFEGGHRGIVVEIPCQKQSAGSAVRTTEGTSLSSLQNLVEAGVLTCKVFVNVRHKMEATIDR